MSLCDDAAALGSGASPEATAVLAEAIDAGGAIDESATVKAPKSSRAAPVPRTLQVFSYCFMGLFMAFLVLQQFLSSVLNQTGFWVLASIYAAFFVGTLLSPRCCRRLGLKAAMVSAACAYTTLHVCVAVVAAGALAKAAAVGLVLVGGAVCGGGAAVLWTAQGAYCAAIEQHCEGATVEGCQSYFWGRLSTAGCFGFGFALVLLGVLGLDEVAVLWILAAVSAAAVFVFALRLPPLEAVADEDAPDDASLATKLSQTLSLFARRDICLKAVSFCHLGAQEGLFWGVVTAQMSPTLIATSFLVHGALSASCCVVTGWRWGGVCAETKALALAVLSVVGLAVTAAGLSTETSESSVASSSGMLLCVGTAIFGLTDFPAHSLLRGSVGRAFQGSPLLEASMANVIFCLTTGNIVFFVAGPMVDAAHQAIAVLGLGLLSTASLVFTVVAASPAEAPAAAAAAVALPLHK